jgi:hypothetical protein
MNKLKLLRKQIEKAADQSADLQPTERFAYIEVLRLNTKVILVNPTFEDRDTCEEE